MKTTTKILTAASVLVLALSMAAPVDAACAGPGLVTTQGGDGTSFIFGPQFRNDPTFSYGFYGYAPQTTSAGAPGTATRPLSDAARITFWELGAGDPLPGMGTDSGVKDIVSTGFYVYGYDSSSYYPGGRVVAGVLDTNSNWAGGDTDGCVSGGGCLCVLITDQDGDQGYFAITGGVATGNSDTFLNRAGTSDGSSNPNNNAPIELVAIPGPNILSSSRDGGTNDLTLNVTVPAGGGDYTQDGCNCAPTGYRILASSVPFGNMPPADRDEGAWTAPTLADGVTPQGSTALGGSVMLAAECTGSTNEVYLTTQLLFDSGFQANVVSSNSTRVECDPTLATPGGGRGRPEPGDRPGQDRPRGRKR